VGKPQKTKKKAKEIIQGQGKGRGKSKGISGGGFVNKHGGGQQKNKVREKS